MKKSTIVVVITAIVMITIGIGLCIGGAIAVGGVTAANGVLEDNGIYINHGFQIDVNRSKTNSYTSFSKYDVDKLVLDVGAAEVVISEKTGQKDIGVYVNDGKFDIKLEDETLYIESKEKTGDNQLEVYFPVDFFFEDVGVFMGASNIEFQGLIAESLYAEIGAGKMNVQDGKVDECSVDLGMGNFEYEGIITGECTLECGMGNMELCLEGEKESFNYEIDCAAGNVTVGNENFGGVVSDREIDNGADRDMDIDCGMGNVTIIF